MRLGGYDSAARARSGRDIGKLGLRAQPSPAGDSRASSIDRTDSIASDTACDFGTMYNHLARLMKTPGSRSEGSFDDNEMSSPNQRTPSTQSSNDLIEQITFTVEIADALIQHIMPPHALLKAHATNRPAFQEMVRKGEISMFNFLHLAEFEPESSDSAATVGVLKADAEVVSVLHPHVETTEFTVSSCAYWVALVAAISAAVLFVNIPIEHVEQAL